MKKIIVEVQLLLCWQQVLFVCSVLLLMFLLC